MKDHGQFGDKPAGKSANVPSDQLDCAAVELLWVEAAEGTLASTVAEKCVPIQRVCVVPRENLPGAQGPRVAADAEAGTADSSVGSGCKNSGQNHGRIGDITHSRWSTPKIPAETDTRTADRYSLPGYSFPDSKQALSQAKAERTMVPRAARKNSSDSQSGNVRPWCCCGKRSLSHAWRWLRRWPSSPFR